MIDKQLLRESVAYVLADNTPHAFKHIAEEVLNSKEFMQKIYRKSYRLFCWLTPYIENREVYDQVIEDQEVLELGNAFNNFCHKAKLVKPNYKVNLEELTRKEVEWFEAFLPMYEREQEMLMLIRTAMSYDTYELARNLPEGYDFNFAGYENMRQSGSINDSIKLRCRQFLEKIGDKSNEV